MKKTRIRKVSKKRAKEWKEYLKKRAEFLSARNGCEVEGCTRNADDIHHRRGRSGKFLNDRRSWMSVCRTCHNRIENNKKWARKVGYILYR